MNVLNEYIKEEIKKSGYIWDFYSFYNNYYAKKRNLSQWDFMKLEPQDKTISNIIFNDMFSTHQYKHSHFSRAEISFENCLFVNCDIMLCYLSPLYIKSCKFLNCKMSGFLGGEKCGLNKLFNCIYENCHFMSYWDSSSSRDYFYSKHDKKRFDEKYIRSHLKQYLILSLEDTDTIINCKLTGY